MSAEQFFPTVERLEKLVPELLQVSNTSSSPAKSNCLMLLGSGVRRWVILRSLYDNDSEFFVEFESEFNCAEWLKKFKELTINYQSYSLDFWLFADYTNVVKNQFIYALKFRYNLDDNDIQELLSTPIFAVTDRTFRNQFTQLAKLKNQLLGRQAINHTSKSKKQIHKFHKRPKNTVLEILAAEQNFNDFDGTLEFFTNEVSAIAELLVTKINGEQRLFIHHEYVVNEDLRESSADSADRLKEIWKIHPTPPIQITYHSAYLNQTRKYTVYPVCLYYYQRAYYLCAFGERPQRTEEQLQLGWYNYRLERINRLKKLSWDTANLPLSQAELINHSEQYSPSYIQKELDSAYGFDFYEKAGLILLRFEADFAQRYIDNSFRHPTFKKLHSYQDAIALIEQLKLGDRKKLLTHINQYPDAAYYTLRYRHQDNNVIMRLRAWGPKVEVIFPKTLRQRMRQDIEQTWQLYKEPLD